jgi:hypothetical protein
MIEMLGRCLVKLTRSGEYSRADVLVWTPASKVVPAKAGTQTMRRAPFSRLSGSDMPGWPKCAGLDSRLLPAFAGMTGGDLVPATLIEEVADQTVGDAAATDTGAVAARLLDQVTQKQQGFQNCITAALNHRNHVALFNA